MLNLHLNFFEDCLIYWLYCLSFYPFVSGDWTQLLKLTTVSITEFTHSPDILIITRLTSIILATQEAKIRRILVWGQPKQIVNEILSRKNSITEKGMLELLKVQALRSNPNLQKNKNKKRTNVSKGNSWVFSIHGMNYNDM
jgi:hypothetical protein